MPTQRTDLMRRLTASQWQTAQTLKSINPCKPPPPRRPCHCLQRRHHHRHRFAYVIVTLMKNHYACLEEIGTELGLVQLAVEASLKEYRSGIGVHGSTSLDTQTRGLTDYGVKDGNPVVLFLEPNVLRYTHCETCNCRRMRRNCVSPHALKDYSLTYHTDGHGVRTILTPPAPLAAVCTIG